jgi:sulfate adenylyltransferase subunit 1
VTVTTPGYVTLTRPPCRCTGLKAATPSPVKGEGNTANLNMKQLSSPSILTSTPALASASESLRTAGEGATHRPLRFITCGSVDDGKSTLIGRLLFDSKALMIDQLDALGRARGAQTRAGELDLSLVTDGLEAEREQGITIDVAYRYFATPKRKFIIADAPGHEQYTRNMVTGASKSDVAVILIDVTKLDFSKEHIELLPQTKRHSAIAGLLGIKQIVVAVNKMDAIDFDREKFERVVAAFDAIAKSLALPRYFAIPISALKGDGVVAHTENTAWFKGAALLDTLESIELGDASNPNESPAARIAVQYVTRDANDDHRRWIMGDLADAALAVGQTIRVFPSGAEAIVAGINTPRGASVEAQAGEAVAVLLDRQVDVARGDWLIANANEESKSSQRADHGSQTATATVAWLDSNPLAIGRRLLARHGTRWLPARVTEVRRRLDLQSAQWKSHDDAIATNSDANNDVNPNDIIEATIEFASPLPITTYEASTSSGAIVLVDPGTHSTAAAAMIRNLS